MLVMPVISGNRRLSGLDFYGEMLLREMLIRAGCPLYENTDFANSRRHGERLYPKDRLLL